MHRLVLLLLGFAPIVTACGGGAGSTPKDTWLAHRAAAEAKDFGALYELVAPTDLTKIIGMQVKPRMHEYLGVEEAVLKNMSPEDFFIAFMKRGYEDDPDEMGKMAAAEFQEEKIEGNRAVVNSVSGGEELQDTFVLVDGKWYLSL